MGLLGRDHYTDDETFLAFTRDLGDLFEQYVGPHLRLLPDIEIFPEIVYGKNGEKSVDWIVVLPGLVLLVEVKSVRPTAKLRLGPDGPSLTDRRCQHRIARAVHHYYRRPPRPDSHQAHATCMHL